jgi:DNA repair ATPase RecN
MPGNSVPKGGAGAPKSPIGVVAHDVLNLITIVYGLQEEIEALSSSTPNKNALVSSVRGLGDKLEAVARRLSAMRDAATESTATR